VVGVATTSAWLAAQRKIDLADFRARRPQARLSTTPALARLIESRPHRPPPRLAAAALAIVHLPTAGDAAESFGRCYALDAFSGSTCRGAAC